MRVRGRKIPQSTAVVVVCPPPPLVLQLPALALVSRFSAAETANSLGGGLVVPTAPAPSDAGVVDVLVALHDAP